MDKNVKSLAQAKIIISGIGLAIANTAIGVNAATMAYVSIRPNAGASPTTYGIASYLTADGNSGSLVVGYAQTEWFGINQAAFDALQPSALAGKGCEIDVEVKNTLLGTGKCDIALNLINKDGTGNKLIELFSIKSTGGQLSGTSVRGLIRLMPNEKAKQIA